MWPVFDRWGVLRTIRAVYGSSAVGNYSAPDSTGVSDTEGVFSSTAKDERADHRCRFSVLGRRCSSHEGLGNDIERNEEEFKYDNFDDPSESEYGENS